MSPYPCLSVSPTLLPCVRIYLFRNLLYLSLSVFMYLCISQSISFWSLCFSISIYLFISLYFSGYFDLSLFTSMCSCLSFVSLSLCLFVSLYLFPCVRVYLFSNVYLFLFLFQFICFPICICFYGPVHRDNTFPRCRVSYLSLLSFAFLLLFFAFFVFICFCLPTYFLLSLSLSRFFSLSILSFPNHYVTPSQSSSGTFPVFVRRFRSLLDICPVSEKSLPGLCSTSSRSFLDAFPIFPRNLPDLSP